MDRQVLWLCPTAGVDPGSPVNGVEFICAHSVEDLEGLRSQRLDVGVVVLDDMPIEPWGYDPTWVAIRAADILIRAPRHIVHVVRPGFQTCSYHAQIAFAIEAHDVLGPRARFHLQLGARFDYGRRVDPTTQLADTAGTNTPSSSDEKKVRSGMQMRWHDIARLASDLTVHPAEAGPTTPLPVEASAVVRAFGQTAGALSPAAQAVLLKLAYGVAPSAGRLAEAAGYAERTIRKAITDVALIRVPEGGAGSHWTMSTAAALAHDYGPWLVSRAARIF